jgi:hypothetical protein
MTALARELDESRRQFEAEWIASAEHNRASLAAVPVFNDSYRRLAAFGAILRDVALKKMSDDAGNFLREAHNNGLTSHILARHGAWRSSLQCLRGLIEETMCGLYYADHPVECQLWHSGKFRIGFTALHKYFEAHPALSDTVSDQNGLALLNEEYETLSRAVHGSSTRFRMTEDGVEVVLWSADGARAGQWGAREKRVLEALSLLIALRYREELVAARQPNVRSMMMFVLSRRGRTYLKNVARITC